VFVDWKDEDVDRNLVDAFLLNTTRIGHGFALNKHPLIKQLLEKRRIPLEVCPISNRVCNIVFYVLIVIYFCFFFGPGIKKAIIIFG